MLQPTLGGEGTTCTSVEAPFSYSPYVYSECAVEVRFALNVRPGVSPLALGNAVYPALTTSSFQARALLPALQPCCCGICMPCCLELRLRAQLGGVQLLLCTCCAGPEGQQRAETAPARGVSPSAGVRAQA